MYKMKPHAMKAAEKLGLDPKDPANIYKGDDGLWHVRIIIPKKQPAPQDVAQVTQFPDKAAPVPQNPVAFIREYMLQPNPPDRKTALAFFEQNGINSATAKTQYQRFKK